MNENENFDLDLAEEETESAPVESRRERRKKKSRRKRIAVTVICVLLGLILLLVAAFFILREIGRGSMTNDGGSVDFSSVSDAYQDSEGYVRYKDRLYKYNDEISCVLLMGVDDYEMSDNGERHQTDVNVLAVMDPVNKKISLIAISRDAMCNLEIYDDDTGEFVGMAKAQLALAYSYADNDEESCALTVKAVSDLFYGIEIPAYASIYMDGLSEVVDALGGVNVVPETSFGRFTAGREVCLKGSLTEAYIRPREHTVQGNNERMQRQNQLLRGMVVKALEIAREDPTQVVDIYGSVSDNVTTSLGLSMMVYLAAEAGGMSFDGNIHIVEGESVMGEGNHAEFYVDDDALFELVLDIFYIPVKD